MLCLTGKLKIKTDVLAPDREFTADYKCYHPTRIIHTMLELVKMIWRVPSSQAYWDKVKWDATSEQADFYGEWRVIDKKDRYSKVVNKIVVMGTQGKDKNGKVTVKIKPTLETELDYKTVIDKVFLKMYLDTVYRKQILQYVDLAQRRVKEFDHEVRKILDIPLREHPHK